VIAIETAFRIHQTLPEKISSDLAEILLSRPWCKKVNRIWQNRDSWPALRRKRVVQMWLTFLDQTLTNKFRTDSA
jgi:hypothetical protein